MQKILQLIEKQFWFVILLAVFFALATPQLGDSLLPPYKY